MAYGVDVLDPDVSLRRVHVLLQRLPPHARRAGEQWSIESELLAGLIDHVAQLTWVTLRANGAKSAKRPQPVPRPSDRDRRRRRPPVTAQADSLASAPAKTSSWFAAAKQLAVIPGVVMTEDG